MVNNGEKMFYNASIKVVDIYVCFHQKAVVGDLLKSMISHTTLVLPQSILFHWNRRNELDPKTIGILLFLMCKDVKDLNILMALQ